MLKKFLVLAGVPLLLAGCTTTFTNLTPQQQVRNPNNVYPVEVALDTRQQSLRWESIHPQIVMGSESFPMRPIPMMTNRWEGLVSVPGDATLVHYHYKFDFEYNSLGKPKPDSAISPEYALQILQP
ncbi:MAG TPA: hypothetical protein VG146_08910 [Verrucomicrobiae bacterium]|nr:hypothetical protein [Verrucomicrobiae bacterium]